MNRQSPNDAAGVLRNLMYPTRPTGGDVVDPKLQTPYAQEKEMAKPDANAPLGSGGRFAAMEQKLKGKVRNPAAVAAAIGRKKYGNKKMSQMAESGKKG